MQNYKQRKRKSTKQKPESRFGTLKDYLTPKTVEISLKHHTMNQDIENSVLSSILPPTEVQNVPRRNKWLDRNNVRESLDSLMEVLYDRQKGVGTKMREKQQLQTKNQSGDRKNIVEEKSLESDSESNKEGEKRVLTVQDTTQEETFVKDNEFKKSSSNEDKTKQLFAKKEQDESDNSCKQVVSDSQLYRIKAKRTSHDLDAILMVKESIMRNRRQSNARPAPEANLSKKSRDVQTDKLTSSKSKKLEEMMNDAKTQAFSLNHKTRIIEEKDEEIKSLKSKLEELVTKLIENENQRKALNMELQQTKGNIRIFCRIKPKAHYSDLAEDSRPANPDVRRIVKIKTGKMAKKIKETASPHLAHDICYIEVPEQGDNPRLLSIVDPDTSKKRNFFFDRVFVDADKQPTVFSEFEGYITAAYDGGRIVIFAYGQTGSGKTYTLQGSPADPGILSRALDQLVAMKNRDEKLLGKIEISLSVLEIYNEKLIDLLDGNKKDINIMVKNNTVQLSNLSKVEIVSQTQLDQLIQTAAANRNVEKTAFNDESSRSHCIYRIKISKTDFDGKKTKGLLNIIDLAGCERFSDDIEDPLKLKKIQTEANFINKSLTTLGRILRIRKENRVNACNKTLPIRETKLTRVLQDCMDDEQAVTLMIVNICQDENNFSQTRETLNFSVINV